LAKNVPTITDNDKRAKALSWLIRELEKSVTKKEHMKLTITMDHGLIVHVNESKGRTPPK
jgi:hypothetical protein